MKDLNGDIMAYSWSFDEDERADARELVRILRSRGDDAGLYGRTFIGTGIH